MDSIESICQKLKAMPAVRLEQVFRYIQQLGVESRTERLDIFRQTSGTLTQEEADDWARGIEECGRIDAVRW